eukprot:Nitzschia sp. Nitz4//scaffold119_size111653//3408//4196//NITZ4_004172-RA/size111653-processed-gene-0.25-mRNA-1//-1//CDS//3329533782//108//frame0
MTNSMSKNVNDYQAIEDMRSLIRKADIIIQKVGREPGMGNYIEHCSGIVILSGHEYGLAISGQRVTGILLKHNKIDNSWSLPVATKMASIGVGIQVGAEYKEMIIFLNDRQLRALSQNATLRIGSETGFAVGTGEGGLEGDSYLQISDMLHVTGAGAYTETKGWKFTISIQGGFMAPKWKLNKAFYGDMWNPRLPSRVSERILRGEIVKDVSALDREMISKLHQSLQTAIQNKWVPHQWTFDEHGNTTSITGNPAFDCVAAN